MNLHWFNPDLANKLGLEAAIIFQAIGYWTNHNKRKPDRVKDGKPWFYMSRQEWLEEYPYIGEGTLRASVERLVAQGLIERGNFSQGMYKRTTWYTLTSEGWNLWLIQPRPLDNSAKPFGENSQTITGNTKQSITQQEPHTPKGSCVRFDEFWDTWPKHHRKANKPKCKQFWQANLLDDKAQEVIDAVKAFAACWDWRKEEGRFIPAPLVWLRQERWENPPQVAVIDDEPSPF